MWKRETPYVKRLIHTLPLVAGCLFLAWVMVLLVGDVVDSYGLEGNTRIIKEQKFDSFSGGGSSLWGQSSNSFAHIVNAFSYYYNRCGYYDDTLSYMPIRGGRVSENGLHYAFVELYLLLVSVMAASVIIRKRVTLCYIVSGALLVLILIVGKSPAYTHLMLLVSGWIYLNLAGNFVKLKGTRSAKEFWQEFPIMIFPVYGILLFLVLVLSVMLPTSVLPEASKDTKDAIFARLQEIQLVSNQYEEKRRRNEAETRSQQDVEDMEDEEDVEAENDEIRNPETNEADPGEESQGQENDIEDENSNQNSRQDTDDLTGQNGGADHSAGNTGNNTDTGFNETGVGFSLRSGGGVSRGRTDRTGNLDFSGKTVLRAYSDFKPEETMYIRLYYGEDYEDNRWKQTEEKHFDEGIGLRSIVTDYDGDGEQDRVLNDIGVLKDNEVLKLTMPTFYGLNSGSLNGQTEKSVVHLEYSSMFSESQTFGDSRRASALYPETEHYLKNTCKAVPEELQELFTTEFSDVFQSNLNSFSRLEIAGRVEQLLEETAYYTLSPGKAPGNKDFITWFLTENRRGYCMHFASAGVMMLREAGISARYAEGYSVPASAWTQQEDGTWCAEVKDSNAHAWAEIYSSDSIEYGYWIPVELTPAYNGELADSFAGQPDMYVGRLVVPGVIVKIIKIIFQMICAFILVIVVWILYRRGRVWYEKRLIHTGSRRQDVKNMMKILLKRISRRNPKVRAVIKQENLTLEEFKIQIPSLVSEFNQDAEAADWFGQLGNYAYKAAFGAYISRQERADALNLYRKLRRKLNQSQVERKTARKRRKKHSQ